MENVLKKNLLLILVLTSSKFVSGLTIEPFDMAITKNWPQNYTKTMSNFSYAGEIDDPTSFDQSMTENFNDNCDYTVPTECTEKCPPGNLKRDTDISEECSKCLKKHICEEKVCKSSSDKDCVFNCMSCYE